MTKREEIDQLMHNYSMLEWRLEAIEKRLVLPVYGPKSQDDEPKSEFHLLNIKTLEDVQKAWSARNSSLTSKARATSD